MRLHRVMLLTTALLVLPATLLAQAPVSPQPKALKLGIVGFHHDHVFGFFRNYLRRTDIDIVGYVEANRALADKIAQRDHLDPKIIFPTLDEMIAKAHPQAVCTYTSTFEHRAVVETCPGRAST